MMQAKPGVMGDWKASQHSHDVRGKLRAILYVDPPSK